MNDIRSQFRFFGGAIADPMRGVVFDPATIAMLSTISTIAAPVVGVMGAVAEIGEAKAQEAEYERQAKEERIMANVQAERERRASRQEQSRSRVAMLEAGALAGTGEGVLEQNAVAQELDALTIEFQGEQRARSAEYQAAQARRAASPLKIFSAAISGFSQMDPLNIGN